MKVYVKSAGRKASQDYVWKVVDTFGGDDKSDRELLSMAEKSTVNRGRVASFAGEAGGRPFRFALFFGNVGSGRSDFYGTPILNRIGFVFDAEDEDDIRFAQNIALDWYSVDSALEKQLAIGIGASENTIGFALSSDFSGAICGIANASSGASLRADADQELFASIEGMSRLASGGGHARGSMSNMPIKHIGGLSNNGGAVLRGREVRQPLKSRMVPIGVAIVAVVLLLFWGISWVADNHNRQAGAKAGTTVESPENSLSTGRVNR